MFSTNPGDYPLTLKGPAGNLEARLTIPNNQNLNFTAIICHPHSLHGGSMTNKVVTTLARIFNDLGIATERFNFRGVGQSEGVFAEGVGEADDLRAVIAWVKQQRPNSKICLAGFSFGSFVAFKVSFDENPALLISVAPPIHHFKYDEASLPSCPWIVIQGEKDEIVEASQVFNWISKLPRHVELLRFPETDHFFHGKLVLLRESLTPLLTKILFPTGLPGA